MNDTVADLDFELILLEDTAAQDHCASRHPDRTNPTCTHVPVARQGICLWDTPQPVCAAQVAYVTYATAAGTAKCHTCQRPAEECWTILPL